MSDFSQVTETNVFRVWHQERFHFPTFRFLHAQSLQYTNMKDTLMQYPFTSANSCSLSYNFINPPNSTLPEHWPGRRATSEFSSGIISLLESAPPCLPPCIPSWPQLHQFPKTLRISIILRYFIFDCIYAFYELSHMVHGILVHFYLFFTSSPRSFQ